MTNYNSITIITCECICEGNSERKEAIKGQSQTYKVYFFTENKWLVYNTSRVSHCVVRGKSVG